MIEKKCTLRYAVWASAVVGAFAIAAGAAMAAGGHQGLVKVAVTSSNMPAHATTWNFDHDRGYRFPKNWTAVAGNWKVLIDRNAPSFPNTLGLPGYGLPRTKDLKLWFDSFFTTHYLLAMPDDPTNYADFTYQASFNPWGGAWGSYAGLVFRYVDSKNYYVLAAACPKDYLALYRMSGGTMHLIKKVPANLFRNRWYTFKVDAKGSNFTCFLNGKKMFEAHDSAIARGRIGVWSQNDSRVSFDNVKITPAAGGQPTA